MKSMISILQLVAVGVALLGSGGVVWALPPDHTITYKIRETPTDETSAVVFTVRLDLTADGQTGNTVSWEIKNAEFAQAVVGGTKIVWNALSPLGVQHWEVVHADADKPVAAEFDQVPLMLGTAEPVDVLEADLDYDLIGDTYASSPSMFSSNFAALTYAFTKVNETEPEEEGEYEPVELDEEHDP